MPLYLGLDASAQGLTAIVIEVTRDARRIVFRHAVNFDRDLPEYGTVAGVAVGPDDRAIDPSAAMWADALDRTMRALAMAAEIDIDDVRAVSGAASPLRTVAVDDAARVSLGSYMTSLLIGNAVPAAAEVIGTLSSHWHRRYTLPAARVVVWSGDSESRLIGTGVIRPGTIGISLGTSDVLSASSATKVSSLSFRNGSLAREWVRLEYRLSWNQVAAVLEHSPGNGGYIVLPWLEPEMTPMVAHAGIRRFGFDHLDMSRSVRGLIEGQMMAMANHAGEATSDAIDRIIATGAAAMNRSLLQVMANVFGVDVYRLDVDHAAALGAALRAYQGDRLAGSEPLSWQSVVSGFIDPNPGHRVSPNPRLAAMYRSLRREYAILERLHKDRPAIC